MVPFGVGRQNMLQENVKDTGEYGFAQPMSSQARPQRVRKYPDRLAVSGRGQTYQSMNSEPSVRSVLVTSLSPRLG